MSLSLVKTDDPQPKCHWQLYLRGKEIVRQSPDIVGLTDNELFGISRRKEFVEPRHVVSLALRKIGLSYMQVANLTGRDDHSSAFNSVKRAKKLVRTHRAYAQLLDVLEAVE